MVGRSIAKAIAEGSVAHDLACECGVEAEALLGQMVRPGITLDDLHSLLEDISGTVVEYMERLGPDQQLMAAAVAIDEEEDEEDEDS